ncbi:MAG: aminodeoxychorismate/anthranilate synthase component II [Deltaproteobacteria bacterium]|nr:aminodeoxychorismate/anthranilate synthase component II [Deltaproteobacteria bacterium]
MLDNLDSFTYNLFQLTAELGFAATVKRATETSLEAIATLKPQKIVISPGPKRPQDHPFIFEVLARFAGSIPILGVCLGMQAINEWHGGTICRDTHPMHGRTSVIEHDGSSLFEDIPTPCEVARYHSLRLDGVAEEMSVIAWTSDRIPMAIQHRSWPLFGVQFHPESFLTPHGKTLLRNFYRL